MRILDDTRPTLASWPKRIYEWDELPAQYHAYFARWRELGMPAGNVTLIPRIHQYKEGLEYVVAWLGDEVALLVSEGGAVRNVLIRPEDVLQVEYGIELLDCSVRVTLKGYEPGTASFHYNKTKEDQLLPVLNLLLGNAPDKPPTRGHPSGAMEKLLQDSYAMYYTSWLCYRFGTVILDSYWTRWKKSGFVVRGKEKTEFFLARTERGFVFIYKDFYGNYVKYLRSEAVTRVNLCAQYRPKGVYSKPYAALLLESRHGAAFAVPVAPKRWEEAARFAAAVSCKR